MNTTDNTDNTAIGATFTGDDIAFGSAKPLDVKTLLNIFWAATKATDRDGSVSIDAETLRKMAEELIMAKSENGTPIISRGKVANPGYTYLSGNTGSLAI